MSGILRGSQNRRMNCRELKSLLVLGFFILAILLSGVVSVQAVTAGPRISITDQGPTILFTNRDAAIEIKKAPFEITFQNATSGAKHTNLSSFQFMSQGRWNTVSKVSSEQILPDSSLSLEAELTNGSAVKIHIFPVNDFAFHLRLTTNDIPVDSIRGVNSLAGREEVYGFGEMWDGTVAQRGRAFDVWDYSGTPDECAYMPYYVTTRDYAFFLNYGGLVRFDVGKTDPGQLRYTSPARTFDITLVSGNSIPAAVDRFFSLAGKPAVPPRWAFQPWTWLMGPPEADRRDAGTEALRGHDLIQAADHFRDLDIPVKVVWFEPPWETARTSFLPSKVFSRDLPATIDTLHHMGLKVLAWTVPYTTPSAPNWDTAVANRYLVKNSEGMTPRIESNLTGEEGYYYLDFYNPAAVRWWKTQIAQGIAIMLDGFKLDAGQRLPEDARLFGGRRGADVHNAYAREYNRTFHEILSGYARSDFLMIPRAAWVGSGRYTNFKWPGDLEASFADNGLPSSVYSSLSLAFSGLPFVSTDIGGFANRPPSEQVWVRWAQFGAFLPGMQTLNMPWWYSDRAVQHYRYLSWLHTELVPFWMSLAREAHRTATPVCRPLVWNFQQDEKTWRVGDEFMLGDALLVAPVITPENSRSVYLPEGTWYDFRENSKEIRGPTTIQWKGNIWDFPVYIRAGAIFPMEVENDVTGFGWKESEPYLTMNIFPGEDGRSAFTLQDKKSPVRFVCENRENTTRIRWSASDRDYLFRIHVAAGRRFRVMDAAGQPVRQAKNLHDFQSRPGAAWYFDRKARKMYVTQPGGGKTNEITIIRR